MAPDITIASPIEGASYFKGQVVNANYTCTDPGLGVGIATCDGPVPNGAPIDTGSAGAKQFTVNSTDLNGNPSTQTINYTVEASADPLISVLGGAAPEGSDVPFTVKLSKPPESDVTVDYDTSDGTAGAGDYTDTSGTLTFLAGTTTLSQTVNVPATDDNDFETTESVVLDVSNASNANIESGFESVSGNILDNDAPPVLVDATSATEGTDNSITFTLTPSQASPVPFSVAYATADDTAVELDGDYVGTSGVTADWPAGDTTPQTVVVTVNDDLEVEDLEQFTLDVTQYDGTVTSTAGAIADNDPEGEGPYDMVPQAFSIGDVTVTETSGNVVATRVAATDPARRLRGDGQGPHGRPHGDGRARLQAEVRHGQVQGRSAGEAVHHDDRSPTPSPRGTSTWCSRFGRRSALRSPTGSARSPSSTTWAARLSPASVTPECGRPTRRAPLRSCARRP